MDFVISHCREPMDWVDTQLVPVLPRRSALLLYEKCGEVTRLPHLDRREGGGPFDAVLSVPRPDYARGVFFNPVATIFRKDELWNFGQD